MLTTTAALLLVLLTLPLIVLLWATESRPERATGAGFVRSPPQNLINSSL